MNHLDVLAQEKPLVEIAAKALPVEQIPKMLFVHRGVAMRQPQTAVKLPIHPDKEHDVRCESDPDRQRNAKVVADELRASRPGGRGAPRFAEAPERRRIRCCQVLPTPSG